MTHKMMDPQTNERRIRTVARPRFELKVVICTQKMAFGTDKVYYGVCLLDNFDATMNQAFGRAGRTRNNIVVPVIASKKSLQEMMESTLKENEIV